MALGRFAIEQPSKRPRLLRAHHHSSKNPASFSLRRVTRLPVSIGAAQDDAWYVPIPGTCLLPICRYARRSHIDSEAKTRVFIGIEAIPVKSWEKEE